MKKILAGIIIILIVKSFATPSVATVTPSTTPAAAPITAGGKANSTTPPQTPSTSLANVPTVTVAKGIACGPGTACKVVSDTSNQAVLLINRGAANQMVNVVSSQFDFSLMTRSAMGYNWKMATKAQQDKVVNLFKQLLIYTYSMAISKFKDAKTNIIYAKVEFHPAHGSRPSYHTTAVVCQITLPETNKSTKVEYDLADNSGSWKAYDVKIEDLSLITMHRTQFNEAVQRVKIAGLIQELESKVALLQNPNRLSK